MCRVKQFRQCSNCLLTNDQTMKPSLALCRSIRHNCSTSSVTRTKTCCTGLRKRFNRTRMKNWVSKKSNLKSSIQGKTKKETTTKVIFLRWKKSWSCSTKSWPCPSLRRCNPNLQIQCAFWSRSCVFCRFRITRFSTRQFCSCLCFWCCLTGRRQSKRYLNGITIS